ncbi:MAG: hypothetical protein FGM46_03740 [Ferruginibacter sp.]|nr:hypothetical protein [Ferruginibacter sp.]
MFPEEYLNFGYLEIDGSMVRVYKAPYDWRTICVQHPIEKAYWSGKAITVVLKSGQIRVYRQFEDFYYNPEIVKY